MRVEISWTGARFEVGFLDTAGTGAARPSAPALDFFEALNAGGTAAVPAKRYRAMIHRIQKHADAGPLTNREHSRSVGDEIFEFKTTFGDRMLYFYDSRVRGRTVLTNGFTKGDSLDNARRVARRLKEQWEEWQRIHPEA